MDINFSQGNQQASLAALLHNKETPAERFPKDSEANLDSVDKAVKAPSEATESSKVIGLKADTVARAEIETAVSDMNDFVQSQSRNLNFSIDEASKRSVVKVTDVETGDVIRQLPSDEVLKLAARIQDLQSDVGAAVGVLFNKAV
ncbi:flagellar protein FlaG [Alteromonadaceae bacterium BrNp21-10]|nr:flagellar protein FlaG [Alteromonadaceae bacterium BrNp21-10]